MRQQTLGITSVLILLIQAVALAQEPRSEEIEFFETRIRPVLIERCYECHGRENPRNGLRVDSREALLNGGASGPAIVERRAADSLLIQAIRRTSPDLQMPPKTTLPQLVISDFELWINAGAAWPKYEAVKERRIIIDSPIAARGPNDADFKTALQVWLKADGQPWRDGQSIYLWEDSSGRGHDLAATSGTRINGIGGPAKFISQSTITGFPAVRFDASTGLGGNSATAPNIDGDAEFTMFVVARFASDQPTNEGLIAGFGEPSHAGNPGMARCALIGIQPGAQSVPIFVGGWGNDARPSAGLMQPLLIGPTTIIALTKSKGPLNNTSRFHLSGQDAGAMIGNAATPNFGLIAKPWG